MYDFVTKILSAACFKLWPLKLWNRLHDSHKHTAWHRRYIIQFHIYPMLILLPYRPCKLSQASTDSEWYRQRTRTNTLGKTSQTNRLPHEKNTSADIRLIIHRTTNVAQRKQFTRYSAMQSLWQPNTHVNKEHSVRNVKTTRTCMSYYYTNTGDAFFLVFRMLDHFVQTSTTRGHAFTGEVARNTVPIS